jgi:hypothetical protein
VVRRRYRREWYIVRIRDLNQFLDNPVQPLQFEVIANFGWIINPIKKDAFIHYMCSNDLNTEKENRGDICRGLDDVYVKPELVHTVNGKQQCCDEYSTELNNGQRELEAM